MTLKTCSSGAEFISKFNFDFCIQKYGSIKSPSKALVSKKLNLREIGRIYYAEVPQLLVSAWLTNFAAFMNFSISYQQAKETAMYILQEVGMLNLAEITLLFQRIKKGYYGEFYGKFNPQIVLRGCREYRKERGQIISKMPTDQQNEILNTLY